MKSLFNFLIILLLQSYYITYRVTQKDEKYIVKMEKKLYDKLTSKNDKDHFKKMLFRQIEDYQKFKQTKNISNVTLSSEQLIEKMKINADDYISTKRTIKFFISKTRECSILVNETIIYNKLHDINLIEHMILHNNGDSIEPIGVYSDKVNISLFAFNRKLNFFSIYFDNFHNIKEFPIEIDYVAENLLKSSIEDRKKYNYDRNETNVLANNNSLNKTATNHTHQRNFNWFIWKIINQNLLKSEEIIKIEVYFQLDNFENVTVDFSLNFTKSFDIFNEMKIIKYSWEGILKHSQIIILECKFPLYFENCGTINLNFIMILIGSFFIIILIVMLHGILSSYIFEDLKI